MTRVSIGLIVSSLLTARRDTVENIMWLAAGTFIGCVLAKAILVWGPRGAPEPIALHQITINMEGEQGHLTLVLVMPVENIQATSLDLENPQGDVHTSARSAGLKVTGVKVGEYPGE